MFAKRVTEIMNCQHISYKELASKVGWQYGKLYKKLQSDTFTEQEMRQIAHALNYKVSLSLVDKDNENTQ